MRCVLVALIILSPAHVWAGCGYVRSYYSPSYYTPPTYTPVPIATYYVVPLFSAGYTAPVQVQPAAAPAAIASPAAAAAAPADPCAERLKALEAKYETRLGALEKILAPGSVSTVQPGPAGVRESNRPGLGDLVFTQHCAACHGKDAQAKGKSFVMFEGNYTRLRGFSAADKLKIIGKLNNGTMPPPNNKEGVPPLTDQEIADAISYLDALPTTEPTKP
jgi:mono/diheme cytochrome c family protein